MNLHPCGTTHEPAHDLGEDGPAAAGKFARWDGTGWAVCTSAHVPDAYIDSADRAVFYLVFPELSAGSYSGAQFASDPSALVPGTALTLDENGLLVPAGGSDPVCARVGPRRSEDSWTTTIMLSRPA